MAILRCYSNITVNAECASPVCRISSNSVALTHGSDWLSQGGKTLCLTDIVASEVYAARERLKKVVSNIQFGVLNHRRDIELMPMCNLLYSVLSLRLIKRQF